MANRLCRKSITGRRSHEAGQVRGAALRRTILVERAGSAARTRPSEEGLERVLDAELQDARTAGLGQDLTEVGRVEIHHRVPPVEVIQQIEGLQPEFHVLRPTYRD